MLREATVNGHGSVEGLFFSSEKTLMFFCENDAIWCKFACYFFHFQRLQKIYLHLTGGHSSLGPPPSG